MFTEKVRGMLDNSAKVRPTGIFVCWSQDYNGSYYEAKYDKGLYSTDMPIDAILRMEESTAGWDDIVEVLHAMAELSRQNNACKGTTFNVIKDEVAIEVFIGSTIINAFMKDIGDETAFTFRGLLYFALSILDDPQELREHFPRHCERFIKNSIDFEAL